MRKLQAVGGQPIGGWIPGLCFTKVESGLVIFKAARPRVTRFLSVSICVHLWPNLSGVMAGATFPYVEGLRMDEHRHRGHHERHGSCADRAPG
jgi:hypothetical protein